MLLEKLEKEMTYVELRHLQQLFSQLVATKGHGISYELNFTLYGANTKVKEIDERRDASLLPFFLLDKEGKKIPFVCDSKSEPILRKGEKVIFQRGKTNLKEGQVVLNLFKPDTEEERAELIKKLSEEPVKIEIAKFPEAKLEKAFTAFEGLELGLLMSLEIV